MLVFWFIQLFLTTKDCCRHWMWLGVLNSKEFQAAEGAPSFHVAPFSCGWYGEAYLTARLPTSESLRGSWQALCSPGVTTFPPITLLEKSTKVSKVSYPPPQHSMCLGMNLCLGETDG